MPSKDYAADIQRFIRSVIDADDTPLFSAFAERNRKEVLVLTLAFFGTVGVLFLCGIIVVATLKGCYNVTVKAYAWACKPWTRIREFEQRKKVVERWEKVIERREKAIELKETLIAHQAQNLALDVEIGVCKRLLDILKHSVKSTEEKTSALEKEKESLLHEVRSDVDRGDRLGVNDGHRGVTTTV
ncbi:hypothetical protein EV360DRAFT_77656 [Lentinula raphanica]|nr:hypothetical protein EV360DRAFT_77656 [Lentinula raphanica]